MSRLFRWVLTTQLTVPPDAASTDRAGVSQAPVPLASGRRSRAPAWLMAARDIESLLIRVLDRLYESQGVARSVDALMGLDDRALNDIGLSRCDAYGEMLRRRKANRTGLELGVVSTTGADPMDRRDRPAKRLAARRDAEPLSEKEKVSG
jgi:uncharacterized protein YjiS (DUF1127 family)